jgi:hypothetical protein
VENKDKSIFRSVWEAIVGGTETVLKNQAKNQFATKVELSGNVHQQNISALYGANSAEWLTNWRRTGKRALPRKCT